MENVSFDFTGLRRLVEITEECRTKKTTLSFTCNKKDKTLRGWMAMYISTTKYELHPIMIKSSASSKQDDVLEKVKKRSGLDFGSFNLAVALFRDEDLNKVVEIIYGYYIKLRRNFTPLYIYCKIIGEAKKHGEVFMMYINYVTWKFLKEHA